MEWTKEKTLYFIQLVRERPLLWDVTLEEHRDKQKKLLAYSDIAKHFGITKEEANSKWASLKGQYNRERKKITRLGMGSGASEIYTCKWFAYQEMASLLSCNIPQESITYFANADDTDVDSDSAFATSLSDRKAPKRKKDASDFIASALDRLEAISKNVKVKTTVKTEFDIFGQSVAMQLNNMQLEDALQMQMQIQQMLIDHRLKKLHTTPEYLDEST